MGEQLSRRLIACDMGEAKGAGTWEREVAICGHETGESRGVARISSRRGPNLQGPKVNPLKIQKVIGFHSLFFGGGPNKLKKK